MKVVALGGCGEMGQVAVRTCVEYDFISRLTIADRDGAAATALAMRLGAKVQAQTVDITDEQALVELLSQHDVVLATVGPYYRFGAHVLKAAIKAKCHYIDICDDWEPTLEMLPLHREAEEAGITALLGMGASPGVANMLAVKAMGELDQVENVYTTFGATGIDEEDEGSDGGSSEAAALEHWVYQFTGTIRAQIDGSAQTTSPLRKVELDFPKFGKVVTYSVGHPEPVTLPIYYPEIQQSSTLMVFPDFLISVLKDVRNKIDGGNLTIKQAVARLHSLVASGGSGMSLSDTCRYLLLMCWEILRGKTYLPVITAFASGVKDGRPTRVVAYMNGEISGGMGPVTCIPTSVALAMLAKGEITRTGVFAPEGCIDPDLFFERLFPYYTRIEDSAYGPVRVIVES